MPRLAGLAGLCGGTWGILLMRFGRTADLLMFFHRENTC